MKISRTVYSGTLISGTFIYLFCYANYFKFHKGFKRILFIFFSVLKRVYVSNENEFDLHENGRAGETHFHMNGFARRLVLTHRRKVTRKWPIVVSIYRRCNKTHSGKGISKIYLSLINLFLVQESIQRFLVKQRMHFGQQN